MENLEKIIEQAVEGSVDPEQIKKMVEGFRAGLPQRPEDKDKRVKLRIGCVCGDHSEKDHENEEEKVSKDAGNIFKYEWPLELIKYMADTKGKIEFSKAGTIKEVREDLEKYGIDLDENGTVKDNKKFIEAIEKLMEIKPVVLSKRITNGEEGNAVVKISIS